MNKKLKHSINKLPITTKQKKSLTDNIEDQGGSSASGISFNNTSTGLTAINVQDAIVEVNDTLKEAINDTNEILEEKQDKLIPGEGIIISPDGKTISAPGGGGSSGGTVSWGNISGSLHNQSDLSMELAKKRNASDIIQPYEGGTGTSASDKSGVIDILARSAGDFNEDSHTIDEDSEILLRPTTDKNSNDPWIKKVNVGKVVEKLNIAKKDEIPAKVSELNNDSSFQTKTQVSQAISSALAPYAKTSDTNTELDKKANTADVYTKSQVDGLVSGKANSADVYTKAQVNAALSDKANSADLYDKNDINTLLNDKADKTTVYTKTETNNLLAKKASVSDVPTKTSQLTNDAGFLREHQSLDEYAKKTELPSVAGLVTKETADATYQPKGNYLTEHQPLTDYAKKTEVPKKTSELTNDSNFQTAAQVNQALALKQNVLTPGEGITIENNVISAPQSGGSDYTPGKRIVIKQASDFASLVANTVYEINDDFTLTGTYTVPANVTFYFNGGSISGGTFKCPGDKTATIDGVSRSWYSDKSKRPRLAGVVKFNTKNYNLNWDGGFANDEIEADWFNLTTSHTNNNAAVINSLIRNCHRQILVISRMIPITESITIPDNVQVTLLGREIFQGGYANYTGSCNAGFYIVGKLFSAITQTGGALNLKSITCLGAKTAYGTTNPRYDGSYFDNTLVDPYGVTYTLNSATTGSQKVNSEHFCGFDCKGGNCEQIEDCCFNGFCRGISLDNSKTWKANAPGFITRCFISTCKYGLYVNRTSDFFCTNCKFNSCVSDAPMTNSTYGVDRNNIKSQYKVGAAVYITGTAMIQFDACRWEFNYIGIYIDSSSYNVSVTGSIFDRHTHSILCVNNDTTSVTWTGSGNSSGAGETFPDRRNPAISLNFTGNNILRGLGRRLNWSSTNYSFAPGVAYFAFKSIADNTTDTTIKDADGLRRCNINISGNTICDTEELNPEGGAYNPSKYEYQHAIFFFDCGNNDLGGIKLVHGSNDYQGSKATHYCESSTATSSNGFAIVKGSNNLYNDNINFTTPYKYNNASKSSKCCKCYEFFVKDDIIYAIDTYNGQGAHPISNGGGSEAKHSVKLLFFGNSFTKNSIGYLPFILKSVAPNLEFHIAIASISGAPLAQHYANLLNQAVSSDGTTYNPTSYNYWEISNTDTKWIGGDPSDAHQTWQDTAVSKDINSILQEDEWDIISFQQGGRIAPSAWNTYYKPFIYGIHAKIAEKTLALGYQSKFAWNLTHGSYQSTHDTQKTAWQNTANNAQTIMSSTGTSLILPYGTAVQNLRTTSLDASGTGGDGIGLMQGDNTHLHEGIAKYTASLAVALAILKEIHVPANIVGNAFRMTKTLSQSLNVPYPNYGTSNTVKGIDDNNCFIAQMAAIAAINNPFAETNISDYEGGSSETYTVKNYLNSGGSYIDLGVKVLDERWDVDTKVQVTNTSAQAWLYWFRGNSGQYEQVSQIYYNTDNRWPVCSQSSATNQDRVQLSNFGTTAHTIKTSGTTCYFDNNAHSVQMTKIEMYHPQVNFELFSKIHTNSDGTPTTREVSPTLRLYYFKLVHANGTVALNLVPAVRDSDSKVGLLDQTTNTFYPCVGGSPTVG
ncbi:MAG: DUF4886 domain-containing protein [archaeon]|nr:DUF4886 domain-containing protein [archaeon]